MIVEPADLPASAVGAAVRATWEVDVDHAEHLAVGSGAWHWLVGCDDGPTWFATVDKVTSTADRDARLAAYEAGAELGHRLPFVAAPVYTRDARIAVDIAPGLLLSIAPYVDGRAGRGPFQEDEERTPVARMLADLHRQSRPRNLPVWRPRIGWHSDAGHDDLLRLLEQDTWSGGPWSVPAGRAVADARMVLRTSLRRYALLGAAVVGAVDRWVVTHGAPHRANVLETADGRRLVDWSGVALAPRERDLREVLGDAEGEEPWYAYVEAGGPPQPLSPDTVELFALQWHLSEITENAVRFSRPHEDTPDERRRFGALEQELIGLITGWS